MRRKIWIMAVLASMMACLASEAQFHPTGTLTPDPAPKPSDLTVDQLIAKHSAARGGDQKLNGIQSVKMTGTWDSNAAGSSPITLMIAPGRFMRRIAQGSDVKMANVVDGQTQWELNPLGGLKKAAPMPAKSAARYRRLADPQGPLVNSKAKGVKVEVVGKLPWQSSQVYKLKVTFGDGAVSYLYLDAKTFLLVRTVTPVYVPQLNKDVDLETIYKDFRDVDGVKFPFVEEASAPETGSKSTTTWKTIEVNKPLDPAAFKAPAS